VKQFNPKIVTGLTHRPWVLSRKVDGTEFEGPWHKRLLYPILDVLLEWSHTAWLWYFCGNNVHLMFHGIASRSVDIIVSPVTCVIVSVSTRYKNYGLCCSWLKDLFIL